MKPKRPTETDLLTLVQNGFNAQLPKDREAQPPAAALKSSAPTPLATPAHQEPATFLPMVRITLSIPEELRFRLKTMLINHGRMARSRMTQDQFCAMAIAERLDLEDDRVNPWKRADLFATFLQECLDGGGLAKEWVAGAKNLLKNHQDNPCTRIHPSFPATGTTNAEPKAGTRGEPQP